jgi:hypothetical protein
MRNLVSPVMLLSLGVMQALIPYFIVNDAIYSSYNVNDNSFSDKYLYYWLVLYFSFVIGAFSIELARKKRHTHRVFLRIYKVRGFFNLYKTFLFIAIGMSIYLLMVFNGIPILMYQEDYMIQDSISQRGSMPFGFLGIYQLLSYLLSFMNAVFAINLYTQNEKTPLKKRVFGLISVVFIIFSSLFFGHFQNLVVAMFIMAIIPMIVTNHPYNCYLHIFSIKKHRILLTIMVVIFLIIVSISLFGYTRQARNAAESTFLISGLNYAYSYLFFPLLNGSFQISDIDFINFTGNPLELLKNILPYRVGEYIFETKNLNYAVPEPTAPVGIMASWVSSYGGITTSMFFYFFGILTQLLYRSSNIANIALYSILAWSLFGVHSYSIIFSLNYFILPAIVIYIITSYSKSRIEKMY